MNLTLATAAAAAALVAVTLAAGPVTTTATAQDRSQFTCTQSGEACARYYPQWAATKCAQAAAQCNKSTRGNGMCHFNAPDGSGSGLRRCG